MAKGDRQSVKKRKAKDLSGKCHSGCCTVSLSVKEMENATADDRTGLLLPAGADIGSMSVDDFLNGGFEDAAAAAAQAMTPTPAKGKIGIICDYADQFKFLTMSECSLDADLNLSFLVMTSMMVYYRARIG